MNTTFAPAMHGGLHYFTNTNKGKGERKKSTRTRIVIGARDPIACCQLPLHEFISCTLWKDEHGSTEQYQPMQTSTNSQKTSHDMTAAEVRVRRIYIHERALHAQVVGVLKDGRTYATELVQSRKPGEGYVAQWEHELVSIFSSSPSLKYVYQSVHIPCLLSLVIKPRASEPFQSTVIP